MVVLEELDENNNIISTINKNNNSQSIPDNGINGIFPIPGFQQTFMGHQQVPIFIPNMRPQFPGMPFAFNLQMNQNPQNQQPPQNMFIFRQN